MAFTTDEKSVFIKKLATINFSQYDSFSQTLKGEIDLFLFGSEDERLSIIQKFIEEVLLPQKVESKAAYENAAASVQSTIDTLTSVKDRLILAKQEVVLE